MKGNNLNKILYVHHSGNMGGAPKSLSYILKAINYSKIKPYLINVEGGPGNKLFEQAGIEPIIIDNSGPFHGSTVVNMNWKRFIKNLRDLLPTIKAGYRTTKSINPDLIHLNSTCMFPFAIGAKLFNNEIPIIAHIREPIRDDKYGAPLRFFTKRMVDGVIAISQFDLDSLQLKPKDHITHTIIHNFVDEKHDEKKVWQSDIRKKLGIDKNDTVFLYLARFSEGNGWKELLKYADELIENRSDCHFILAGAHENINIVKYTTKNKHILRFRKDVEPLLSSADIYVCPFTEPHFARGIIEASAFGLPIIAHDIGGVNELVEHKKTGYLYSNKRGFINYAVNLIDNEDLRMVLGKNGIRMTNKKFDFKKNIRKTFRFYNNFI